MSNQFTQEFRRRLLTYKGSILWSNPPADLKSMYSTTEFKENLRHLLYSRYRLRHIIHCLLSCVIVNAMHFTVCYECTELSFFSFFNLFFFDYVIVLLFCVQQWVASIDGNVPFWSPFYVIK